MSYGDAVDSVGWQRPLWGRLLDAGIRLEHLRASCKIHKLRRFHDQAFHFSRNFHILK